VTRKITAALLAACMSLTLSGCGLGDIPNSNYLSMNYIPLENIRLVQCLGIDKSDGVYDVSLCSKCGITNKDNCDRTISAESIAAAYNMIERFTPGAEVYYGQTDAVILGEKTARDGIEEYIDLIERDVDLRGTATVVILRGADAKELFAKSEGGSITLGDALRVLLPELNYQGIGFMTSVKYVASNLAESGVSLCVAMEISPQDVPIIGNEQDAEVRVPIPAGFAVISEGRVQGFLDDSESRGTCYLLGQKGSPVEIVEVEDSKISAQVNSGNVKLRPVWENSELKRLDIIIKASGVILEMDNPLEIMDRDILNKINEAVGRVIMEHMTGAIQASRALNAEFLNISCRLSSMNPIKFSAIADDWAAVWRELPITLSADISLDHIFNISDPQSF
jgi:spore germination protein KC